MSFQNIIQQLKNQANPRNVEGMARFGINTHNTLGVSIPVLRQMAKEIGKNHTMALELWDSGIHEARLLAGFIDVPAMVTKKQINSWVKDFDSWDICDQVCSNLFDKTPFAYSMAVEWSNKEKEFIKRAGFVLMACLAVHDKEADDKNFLSFFPLIIRGAIDERNFVKKAVNWALRQIGKRNKALNKIAIETAQDMQAIPSKSARWIATDALREFRLKNIDVAG
ncbi:MAG: DNA alkylation repair protein [Candidatus Omnitrophica bacterium]|nr:DNA alkylation repair protein [Candidatus Omnitrophota bacterium]